MTRDDALRDVLSAMKADQWAVAENATRAALRNLPNDPGFLCCLAAIHLDRGDELEALRLYRAALYLDSRYEPAYRALANTYYAMSLPREAAAVYMAWSQVDPENAEAQHMIAATTGTGAPARCSDAYLRTVFNNFATSFDEQLLKLLRYRGPEIVRDALSRQIATPTAALDALDLGCGSGLCGPAIRPACRSLIGVDLSDKMIDRAASRHCYDNLVVGEICAFLEQCSATFDLVVAADVLIYFGELGPLLRNISRALRRDGLLIFTVEASTDHLQPFVLRPTGRYEHSEQYLLDALTRAAMEPVDMREEIVRMEGAYPVTCHVATARKAADRCG